MKDYLVRDALAEIDSEVADLIACEAERQTRKLIMVPSESIAPEAVHAALGSVFSHIYAEGYPDERTRNMSTEEILDYASELGHYRRYSDRRYYKGVEYADVLEALTRRRVAAAFANDKVALDQLYVNVQTLSGAPANTAVQYALLKPDDTMLAMALHVGGHLSHGSPVAFSGKAYNVAYYSVNDTTERLDYEAIRAQALNVKPKLIIAGYTSYPWAPDWNKFRQIADEVGAYLLADIAHVAGLVLGGVYPSPVGIADAVTFTTHKTLNGPRGAVILTHKSRLGRKFDRAVFPGFQGGPHMETIAALAVTIKIAEDKKFTELQRQTVRNAVALAQALSNEGVRVSYGGTDTHMVLVDCKPIHGPDDTPLMGDPAARILDLAGIVANRNTIPGDTTALYPSGVRLGTPWVTQRGMKEPHMQQLAHIMAQLFHAMQPYALCRHRSSLDYRARIDFDTLEQAKLEIAEMAQEISAPGNNKAQTGYPHFYFLDDTPKGKGAWERLELVGSFVKSFVDWLTPSNTAAMEDGERRPITLLEADGKVMAVGYVTRSHEETYVLDVPVEKAPRVMTWLRELVDGYVATDDVYGRLYFLDAVRDLGESIVSCKDVEPASGPFSKPYFIGAGAHKTPAGGPLPKFTWTEPEDAPLHKTRLNATHRALGARMVPFGGWDMPVWYTGNLDEHRAVRQAAGLFDVSHMGCWDVRGPEAASFLNMIMVNDVQMLDIGESQYSALFDVDGIPLDDLLVYRINEAHYFIVVNAANNDKDWAWVQGVLNGEVMIDPQRPWVKWDAPPKSVIFRDLRDPAAGQDMRVELALQGPKSRDILLALGGYTDDLSQIKNLPWAGITRVTLDGFDLLVSRTGYTGERIAYELFVHPDHLVDLWTRLLDVGGPFGLKPCGLAARDSLRIEAGLPLYGHEIAGPLQLTMADAGFYTYVKLYRPFFIGREAYIQRENQRHAEVIRFRVPEKGQPKPQQLDRLVDSKGKVVGYVTSCALDTEGYLLGQAYVDEKAQDVGLELYALVTPRRKTKPTDQLAIGQRMQLPVRVEVLSRFPRR